MVILLYVTINIVSDNAQVTVADLVADNGENM